MRNMPNLGLMMASALAALSLLPAQAAAQGGAGVTADDADVGPGGDIIVTARKRNERMIDVPETISAFSEASLQKSGITGIDKLGQAVPNVVLSRRGDNEPNVVIRGIGSFGNVQGIGFYIDDVQNFTDQASRLVDLERVEVLKGPQGTLYGGSSIGGAVKYVTKKPSNEFEGRATAELGGQSIFNANGSVNMPLSDKLAARISAYVDTNDGFMRNEVTGINNDKSEEYGIRAALRFTPSEVTDINFNIRYSYMDNGSNDYYRSVTTRDYKNRQDLSFDVFTHRRVLGGILNIQHELDGISLTSLTSYTERKNRIFQDVDYDPQDGLSVAQHRPVRTKVFTQEARIQSENDTGFNWLLGGYYSRVRDRSLITLVDAIVGVDFGGDPTVLLDFSDNTSLEQVYAGFATVSFESGPFEASMGARLQKTDFYGLNRVIDDSMHVKDTVVLPKLTLSYKIDPAMMLYFNMSQGYEPGRFTLFNETPLVPYKPEKASNFEFGMKGQTADGILSYEVASFYIKSKDRQLETLVVIDGFPNEVIGNVGNARTWGTELSFTVRPTRALSFNLNGGWMDSKFTAGEYDGFRVPYAPRFTGNASADYTVDLSSALKLSLRADFTHNSGFFWDRTNELRQESYNIVGGRIAIGSADDKWEFAVRAENILNEKYNNELQPFDELSLIARRGQPRLFVGSATVRF